MLPHHQVRRNDDGTKFANISKSKIDSFLHFRRKKCRVEPSNMREAVVVCVQHIVTRAIIH